jgi:cytochrome c-type biogenesis protein CcmE
MRIKPVHILGIVVIVGALIFGADAFQSSLTPYVSIAQAKAARGTVQVSGLIEGSGQYQDAERFRFVLKDDQGNHLTVIYRGVKPANFDQAIGAVAVGRYDPETETFQASQVMVKCPSKYEAQYGGEARTGGGTK